MSENGQYLFRNGSRVVPSVGSWIHGPQRKKQMTYSYKTIKSPVGVLKIVASDQGLAAILWENDDPKRVRLDLTLEDDNHPVLLETERQLNGYFAGKLQTFALELDFSGTQFQKKVWRSLLTIPFGETRSYGQVAKQVGLPKAARAVGAASGRNPISIVVPCHRVVGSNGKLTGFAGGLETKAALLQMESERRKKSGLEFHSTQFNRGLGTQESRVRVSGGSS